MSERDDQFDEQQWSADRRVDVLEYLRRQQGLRHGRIGEEPAWKVAPYLSLWAVESVAYPGSVGWWVIAGDVPTDYISADETRDPRAALRAIATEWLEHVDLVTKGILPPGLRLSLEQLAPMVPVLQQRALLLRAWADDDANWEDDGSARE